MSSPDLRIAISDSRGITRHVDLTGAAFVIGRQMDADVVLDHPAVSRHHAELFRDPFGRWWIRDLESRHGVFVNAHRVEDHIVTEQDVIRIGKFAVRVAQFRDGDAEPELPRLVLPEEDDYLDHNSIETIGSIDHVARRLRALVQLSADLSKEAEPMRRWAVLCQCVAQQMPGAIVLALRLPLEPGAAPQEMCRRGPGGPDDPAPHISRTIMSTLLRERQALLASNVSTGSADVELSVTYGQQPLAALACPLDERTDSLDLVYVSAGPEYATSEWLSFVTMAATVYHQDEAARQLHERLKEHDLIEHDLRRARTMQQRLIPRDLTSPGLDLAIGFQPCRWVGGDYVDVLPQQDGSTLVVIADVCGKGLPAALVTGNLHAVVHANVARGASLTELFSHINAYLRETLLGDSFVTMLAARIDAEGGRVSCLSAGHPPPVVVRRDGRVDCCELNTTPPLGLFDLELEPAEFTLAAGDWMCVYTDGVIEIANDQRDRLWEAGFHDMLSTTVSSEADAEAVVSTLNQRLDAFLGRSLPGDDRTLLVARLT